MKRMHYIGAFVPLILLLASCSVGDFAPGSWAAADRADFMAILTVKKTPTDSVYLQLDDSTTIFPRNYQDRFTRMERVLCELTVYNRPEGRFKYSGTMSWAEPIEEGQVTGDLGLDVIDDWMTSAEDGFLTIHYNTWWGLKPVQHHFYVITGTDPADPYTLVLAQKSGGDKTETEGDALICFDINSLPDTGDDYKKLTLKWTTGDGTSAEQTFRFKTRK